MDIDKISIIYFSPGQGTKRLAILLASALGYVKTPSVQINITESNAREKQYEFGSNELVLIATPVYGGRIPAIAASFLKRLNGEKTAAVFLAVYGDMSFGDALTEMNSVLSDKFICVAAVAAIAQHAANPEIGKGRPNHEDKAAIKSFGSQIREKLDRLTEAEQALLPGNTELMENRVMSGISPVTNDKCIYCMLCYRWCPTGAIADYSPNDTDKEKCILCHGCVNRCPVGARQITDEDFIAKKQQMLLAYGNNSKKPELFI